MFLLQYKFLKKDGDPNIKIEGKDAEDWMCIDFGMYILNICFKINIHFLYYE